MKFVWMLNWQDILFVYLRLKFFGDMELWLQTNVSYIHGLNLLFMFIIDIIININNIINTIININIIIIFAPDPDF